MSGGPRDNDYLGHILEAIERIDAYLAGVDQTWFLRDAMVQDAVIRNLEVVGEAARRLSAEFVATTPHIPWRDIAGMRNRLAHGYFAINLLTVWNVTQKDLPTLLKQVRDIVGKGIA